MKKSWCIRTWDLRQTTIPAHWRERLKTMWNKKYCRLEKIHFFNPWNAPMHLFVQSRRKINGAHRGNAVLDVSCIPVSFVNPDKTYLSLFLRLMKISTDLMYEESAWGISPVRNGWVFLCIVFAHTQLEPTLNTIPAFLPFVLCSVIPILVVWTCILCHRRQQQLQPTTFHSWSTSGVELILCTWLLCNQLRISGDAPGVQTSITELDFTLHLCQRSKILLLESTLSFYTCKSTKATYGVG